MQVPQNYGSSFLMSFYNHDYTILGFVLGFPPVVGNYQMLLCVISQVPSLTALLGRPRGSQDPSHAASLLTSHKL